MTDIPSIYIMVYLVIGMMFVHAVEILRATDEKKCGNNRWKFKMASGALGIIIAIICLYFHKTPSLAGYVYAVELLHSAFVRMVNVLRRTEIVYIQ